MPPAAKVFLIGAGPGDPDLLTIKGLKVLKRANVIIYDALIDPVLLNYAPSSAERIFVGQPRHQERMLQEGINRLMIVKARQCGIVVRLKGGDPFIFGRGGEEAIALQEAGIDWEVIPGITAGSAVPAYSGIPLTHRGVSSSVAFVTGHECEGKSGAVDWHRLATATDTLVIFMGSKNLQRLVKALLAAGRPPSTPVAIIESGTCPNQTAHVTTLDAIVALRTSVAIKSPALIVIGEVVRLREELARYTKPAAFNERSAITAEQYDEILSSVS